VCLSSKTPWVAEIISSEKGMNLISFSLWFRDGTEINERTLYYLLRLVSEGKWSPF